MMELRADKVFSGVVLVAAPHMDDEVLACGGMIASLPQKEQIFVVFASDGTKSPHPLTDRGRSVELEPIRSKEAIEALGILGIPEQNIFFLSLPDGNLKKYLKCLTMALAEIIHSIQPEKLLIPFRYDRHPDHISLYQAAFQAVTQEHFQTEIYEYFVYNRYRLLPGGDIRKFIRSEILININIHPWSELKQKALFCYRSQTTLFYSWQTRPILTRKRIEEISHQPEVFLNSNPHFPGASVFRKGKYLILLVQYFEPIIKNWQERLLTVFKVGKGIHVIQSQ